MAAFTEYPELIAAPALLAVAAFSARQSGIPAWLAAAATSTLLLGPDSYVIWLQRTLVQAGYRSNTSLGNFACCKIYLPLLAIALSLVLPPMQVVACCLVLFVLPDLYLKTRLQMRQQQIRRALPQALDLLVMCVDAGLSLDAALQRLSNKESSVAEVLHDELKIVGREILLGMDREQVYNELYERTGVDELRSLCSALNQANKLGLSIARILRSQSEFIRKKLSQKAEEKALKTPIFMAFPLWFFIMPTLLLLVLGPSLIKFHHQLGAASGIN